MTRLIENLVGSNMSKLIENLAGGNVSESMENQMLLTMYQVEIIIDILIKNNFITKEEFKEMMKEKLDHTLMNENEKLEILSFMNR